MKGRKKLFWIFLLPAPLVLVLVLGGLLAQATTAHALECQTCHDQLASMTDMRQCGACHQGSDIRLILTRDLALYHEKHFEEEICYSCPQYQYGTDEIGDFRKTLESEGEDGSMPLKGWSITSDLPNWNALIDERLLILGTNQ